MTTGSRKTQHSNESFIASFISVDYVDLILSATSLPMHCHGFSNFLVFLQWKFQIMKNKNLEYEFWTISNYILMFCAEASKSLDILERIGNVPDSQPHPIITSVSES